MWLERTMLKGGSKMWFRMGMFSPCHSGAVRQDRTRNLEVPGSRLLIAPERPTFLNSQLLNLVRASRQRDMLGFHVEVEGVFAPVAADAGRLHATERGRQMADVLRIEPDHAGLQRIGDAQRAAH